MHLLTVSLIAIFLIGVVVALWATAIFNKVVRLKQNSYKGWEKANLLLKQRYDLLPDLIEMVSPFVIREKKLLESITLLHSHLNISAQIDDNQEMKIRIISELTLSALLRQLFTIIENYPELKSSSKYRNLLRLLVKTEYDFQIERRSYNGIVRDYNLAISMAPDAFVAKLCKFKPLPLFKQGKSGNHVSYGNTTMV